MTVGSASSQFTGYQLAEDSDTDLAVNGMMRTMRFSIRTLLAAMAVVALTMVAAQTHRKAMYQQNYLVQFALEIDTLEQQQKVQAEYRDTMLAQADLHKSLHDNRIRCEQAIETLVQRYGSIEPRDSETLSLRNYPTIRTDVGRAPLSFLVLVPEKRPVWLKYGFHKQGTDSPSDGRDGSETVLMADAPFDHAGPFEMQLPPGEHVVTCVIDESQQGTLLFRFRLNDQVLAQSVTTTDKHVSRSGYMSIAAQQQADFSRKRFLPHLATFRLNLRDEASSESKTTFQLSIWLSERSSYFAPFPRP